MLAQKGAVLIRKEADNVCGQLGFTALQAAHILGWLKNRAAGTGVVVLAPAGTVIPGETLAAFLHVKGVRS